MDQDSGKGEGCLQVSAVIINFNAGPVLWETVRALLSVPLSIEVLIVDNGSTDDSVAFLERSCAGDRRLRIIRLETNLGFSVANNIGMGMAEADWILILNPDCVVRPGALPAALAAMESDKNAGMVGALLRNEDGSEQAGCRRAVPTPWRSVVRVLRLDRMFPGHPRFRCFHLNSEALPDGPIEVEAVSGAFMLVRRKAVEEVGLLDEGYFLHCEDLDWCMRFRQRGWKILFVPGAEAVHYKGACSADRPVRVEWHKHRGMVRFYRKFFRHQYPVLLMWMVTAAVWLRFGLVTSRTLCRRAAGASRGAEQLMETNHGSEAGVRLVAAKLPVRQFGWATAPVDGMGRRTARVTRRRERRVPLH